MKVIKKQDVSGWSFKHTCTKCDSELEADSKDVKYSHYAGDQREPGYETFSASCAVCHQSFNIPASNIPKLLQVEIKQRSTSTHGSGSYWDR